MKFLAGLAQSQAALIGACLAFAAPTAEAKEKAGAPSHELSKDYRVAARGAQAAIDLGDLAAANTQIGSLNAIAVTPAEKYTAAALGMQLAVKRSDPQGQRRAVTAMLDSGGAPPSELAYLRYLAGYLSYTLNQLPDSIAQLSYARQLGFQDPRLLLLLADANLRSGKTAEGASLLNEAMAQQRTAGGTIGQAWYDRAAAVAYKQKDWPGVAGWYGQKLTHYPSPANWRTAISNYLDNPALTPAMKLDLYRLQSANGALASERDYHAYAAAAAQSGQHGEVKALVDAGRAAGKLLGTDTATATIYKTASARAAKDKAALATLAAKAGGAAEAADGYLALGEYSKAAELYRKALAQAPADPGQVNTRLGIALARAGDAAGAKQVLSAVTGPWRDIAQFWLVWAGRAGTAQPVK